MQWLKKIPEYLFYVFLLWSIGFIIFNILISKYSSSPDFKTDAIVTFTGGRNRIAESIELLNQGRANVLFISGVPENISIKSIEKRAGIYADDESQIVLGHEAADTIGNAKETIDWIKNNNIQSVRVVTSNYHMMRSMVELNHYKKANNIKFYTITHPVYSPNVTKQWWKSWGSFKLMALEYSKCLFTIFRYAELEWN